MTDASAWILSLGLGGQSSRSQSVIPGKLLEVQILIPTADLVLAYGPAPIPRPPGDSAAHSRWATTSQSI